ncbi:Pimeloyl-ACP methyl ester carboxylesterase [Sphingobium faniae]|nr:Pimeloyl-ACP methyl ester carboxylesterase [Sphingobium faniae]
MTPRYCYVDGPYGQIHVAQTGAGPPLVLLGGAPRSSRQFATLTPFLSAGHHIIMPDMPGFGNSAPMARDAGISGVAAAIVAALDGLGIGRAHLFGLHSGAKVAAALAAEHPARCASIVIAGKSHSLIPEMDHRAQVMRAIVDPLYFSHGADEAFSTVRGWAAASRSLTSCWWDDALFREQEPDAALRAVEAKVVDDLLGRRHAAAFYEANFAFDFADAVTRISAPALIVEIVSDREDAEYGRQGLRLRACLPAADMRTVPDIDPSGLGVHADPAGLAVIVSDFVGRHSAPC